MSESQNTMKLWLADMSLNTLEAIRHDLAPVAHLRAYRETVQPLLLEIEKRKQQKG